MTCKQVEQYWEDWLGGSPSAELERHLAACPHCRALSRELARTSDWMSLLRVEAPEASPYFWTRLEACLKQGEVVADFWTTLGWVSARAALALAVVVLLLGALVVARPTDSSEPDAATFDAPRTYVSESDVAVPVAGVPPNRDQVVLTLVAYQEPRE